MSQLGISYDQALAVLYLYAASTGGHPGALMAMGYRHLHGYGVPQAMDTMDDSGDPYDVGSPTKVSVESWG